MNDLHRLPRFKRRYASLFDAWVEALESGEYKQTTETLHNEKDGGYCCLGVLCDVAAKRGLCVDSVIDVDNIPDMSDVRRWFVLPDDEDASRLSESYLGPLMDRNDGSTGPRQSFKRIARIIRNRMAPEVKA